LAKATWGALQNLDSGHFNSKVLFLHPVSEYDFVIHFDPTRLNRYYQNVNSGGDFWKHVGSSDQRNATHTIRVDFDPVALFFDDLKHVFDGVIEFFYDPYGGTSVGGLWHPSVIKTRPFRVLAGYTTTPHRFTTGKKGKETVLVDLNKASIYSEIQRMGEGLIKTIEIHL